MRSEVEKSIEEYKDKTLLMIKTAIDLEVSKL